MPLLFPPPPPLPLPPGPFTHRRGLSMGGTRFPLGSLQIDRNKIHAVTMTGAPLPTPINEKVRLFARSSPRKTERFASYFEKKFPQ